MLTLKVGRCYKLMFRDIVLERIFQEQDIRVGMVFECFDIYRTDMVLLRPVGYTGRACWINYKDSNTGMWAEAGVLYKNKRRTS